MMNTDFGSIEKSLNVETSIVPKEEPKKPELPNVVLKKMMLKKITNIQEVNYIH